MFENDFPSLMVRYKAPASLGCMDLIFTATALRFGLCAANDFIQYRNLELFKTCILSKALLNNKKVYLTASTMSTGSFKVLKNTCAHKF